VTQQLETDTSAAAGNLGAPPAAGSAGVIPRSFRELLAVVREDHVVNSRGLWAPGFYALAVHRFGAWAYGSGCPRLVAPLARRLHLLGYVLARNVLGIELPWSARLGRRLEVGHQHAIVVHPHAVIGDDCTIRQGVTLGAASGDPEKFVKQGPKVGNGVSLGAGSVVVGGVRIGDGAMIGPNAVVMTHVPAGARVLAQPPRIVRGMPA
jgi:serine O-acetyltransferase